MKKNELPKLSPYRIWWVIVTPFRGCVRKTDIKRLGGDIRVRPPFHEDRFCVFFPSKEKAIAFVTANHNLSKPYGARLLSDKQFGNIKVTYSSKSGIVWDIPYTSMQAAEIFVMQ